MTSRQQWSHVARIALSLTLGGCTTASNRSVTSNAGVDGDAVSLTSLTVSSGTLEPAFDPATTDYAVSSLDTLHPVTFTVTAPPEAELAVDGVAAVSGTPLAIAVAPRHDVAVTVGTPGGPVRTYTVHALPPDFPAFTVTSMANAGTEPLLLTPALGWLAIVDRSGNPLFYRRMTAIGAAVGDFKRVTLPSGAVRYVYAVFGGDAVVLDDAFRELRKLTLVPTEKHGIVPLDGHDLILLGDDHWVTLAYVPVVVDLASRNATWSSAAPVLAAVVQEVDHGSVVFDWMSTDVPSLFDDSIEGNTFQSDATSDYVHVNSVVVDDDDNFLVSLRHTSSVLKLDRRTGEVLWTLGGRSDQFGLSADQLFSHQHDVRRLDDGSVSLFDNGNDAHPTRVVRFRVDEASHTVSDYAVVTTRADAQLDTSFMGSATWRGGDRWVIGWGGHGASATPSTAVTETIAGTPVWTLTFTDPKAFSYRAEVAR